MAILVFDKVAGVDTGNTPYPLFAYAALLPWTFFANSLSLGVPSIPAGQQMVTRFAFPRAVLPLALLGTSLLDLFIASVGFVAFALAFGYGIPLTALWFPLILMLEIVLAVGVVLLFAALNVFARDIRLAVPIAVQLWLFLTPVMYPLREVPEGLRQWYRANPMTGIIESFRNVLVDGRSPDLPLLVPSLIGAAAFLVVGIWYFGATERRFADVI
jgi:lipopolysaccharide transport system permease protein